MAGPRLVGWDMLIKCNCSCFLCTFFFLAPTIIVLRHLHKHLAYMVDKMGLRSVSACCHGHVEEPRPLSLPYLRITYNIGDLRLLDPVSNFILYLRCLLIGIASVDPGAKSPSPSPPPPHLSFPSPSPHPFLCCYRVSHQQRLLFPYRPHSGN